MYFMSWSIQVLVGHFFIEGNSPGFTTQCSFNSIIFSPLLAWDTKFRPMHEYADSRQSYEVVGV